MNLKIYIQQCFMVGRKNKNIMVGKYNNNNNVNKKGTPTSMSMTFILIIYTFFS